MKKLLLVLAIGSFVACNDSASSTEKGADSSAGAMSDSVGSSVDTGMSRMSDTGMSKMSDTSMMGKMKDTSNMK